MITLFQTNFPPQNTPIIDKIGTITTPWMAFLRALYDRTGQGTGLPNQTANVTAAGTAAATAQALTSDWNYVNAGGGGVILAGLQGGQMMMVQNASGGGITVYPPAGTIDGAASYALANTKMQIFWFISGNQIISTQLG